MRTYTRAQFSADVVAGIIVGIVALPLAIAFAIASGLTPDRGLYTAVIAGFLISALGGSRVQIGGPTGAFVVIVYGIVQQYGVDGLLVATLMAGVVLIAFGLARSGRRDQVHPVSGRHRLHRGHRRDHPGAAAPRRPGTTHGARTRRVRGPSYRVRRPLGTVNPHAVGVTLLTLLILLVWPRVSRRLPAPFVALIATTVGVQVLGLPVETIGSRFGEISAALPASGAPVARARRAPRAGRSGLHDRALGAIESLLSAVVADGMIGGRHRSNMELVAQGVANIASPLFGGMPATGAIARTATNIKSGGRTPVAGIVHALTLLLITLFFGRWAALIPLAALAAIVLVVAYRHERVATCSGTSCAPRRATPWCMVITFALTILVDLTVGDRAWGWCWPRSCS